MRDWTITWDEHEWTPADLTVAHLALIVEGRLVDDWAFDPTAGPMRLIYVLAAFIAVDTGQPLRLVLEGLYGLPASTLVEALDVS